MLKAILFDLDNTLINFLHFKVETAKAAAAAMVKHGLPATELQAYGKIFSVYDERGIEYQKTFYEVVKPFGLEINQAERIQQAAILAYLETKFRVLRSYPSVRPALSRLAGKYKLGIVTDAPRNKAWQRLILTGLHDAFDFVVTHEDTMENKPHPSVFNLALKKLGVLPEAVLFVGDNSERDILGARDAGMKTCLAKYGAMGRRSDVKADFEIGKFEDLLKVVEELEG
ncbi:MAG TPA: HAD-IA family hydrolase [Candidatus Bilamarchaeum sp.]|nr:HAD-IA family hydrolase [Candidatus Bilamarchaeum sp.]